MIVLSQSRPACRREGRGSSHSGWFLLSALARPVLRQSAMRSASRIILLACLWCAALPESGRADAPIAAPEELTHLQFDLDYGHLSVGPFFGLPGATVNNVAMAVDGQINLHRHIAFTFAVPWVVGEESDIAGTHATFGNLIAGLQGFGRVRSNVLLWGGLSGGVPTLYQYSPIPFSLGTAAVLLNPYNFDRYDPEAASVRPFFGGEVAFAGYFRDRFEAAMILLVAPDAASTGSAPLPTVELSNELEAQLPRDFLVGIRAQYWTALESTPTDVGLAGGAYVGYSAPRRGVFVRLGFLISPLLLFPPVSEAVNLQLRIGYQF